MLNLASGVTLIQAEQNSLNDAVAVAKAVAAAVNGSGRLGVNFPNTDIGNQLAEVGRIIQVPREAGRDPADLLHSQDGYDTHSDQLPQRAQLLGNLVGALAAYSGRLQALCGSRPSSNTVPGREAFNDRRDLQK
jgi:uncharacterized protein (DUF1501 family)